MIRVLDTYLAKRRAKQSYSQTLATDLQQRTFDLAEQQSLLALASETGLSGDEARELNRQAIAGWCTALLAQGRITDDDEAFLLAALGHCALTFNDLGCDTARYQRCRLLTQLEQGVLQPMTYPHLDIILQPSEVTYWGSAAELRKHKRVTQRVSYGGASTSIRIAKGVRYRAGSYSVSRSTKDVLVTEDRGTLWITNKRICFNGPCKNFSVPFDKILHLELNKEGLLIAKNGRETPYLVGLGDYEVPAAIISHILNQTTAAHAA